MKNNPSNFYPTKNRDPEIAQQKCIDFLIHLKDRCDKGEIIGYLHKYIREFRISTMSATVIQTLGIVERMYNGRFKWNGFNGNLNVNISMAIDIKNGVKVLMSKYPRTKYMPKKVNAAPVNIQVNVNDDMIDKILGIAACLPNSLTAIQKKETIKNLMHIV